MVDLLASRYNMFADAYDQTSSQNDLGQITRDWNYDNPVVEDFICLARGIQGGGIRVVGSTERWEPEFEDVEWLRMQTQAPLSKRYRIGNIRDRNGNIAWFDEEGNSLIFNIMGYESRFDPFSRRVENEVLLKRVQHGEN